MSLYFEKQVKKTERADHFNSVTRPAQLPGFVVCHNYNWEDNGFHNWFCLHYFDENGNWRKIGDFHLMHVSGESMPQMPDSFQSLSDDFCSLGNNVDFYESLYNRLGTELSKEVLAALQDSAVNLTIHEKYKDNDVFKHSLRRETFDTERALRMARFAINGRDVTKAFLFKYNFSPRYNLGCVTEWSVDFRPKVHPFRRLVGVIGENGVGKTQLLYKFISDLLVGKKDVFGSELPIFSSVIAICSTPFDAFMDIEDHNYTLPYFKCCVEQNKQKQNKRCWKG